MLEYVSEAIRECLLHAADYRNQPRTLNDPEEQQRLRDMELRWLDLAMDYEFEYRFSRSACAVG